MFEPEVYRKEMYCTEESTCDIVGTFRRPPQSFSALVVIWCPRSDSVPGELRPLDPGLVTPLATTDLRQVKVQRLDLR